MPTDVIKDWGFTPVIGKNVDKLDAGKYAGTAEERAKALVSQEEIVKQAQQKAAEITLQTQQKCRDMRKGAQEFTEDLLRRAEESLVHHTAEIHQARQALRKPAVKDAE